ncbi:lipopolysaccharide biosynthesis protein [Luteolibacter soli]|uniref:Polysaccharide biosynthesis protein n=1 Tax=Luteolibacter soli TaxID=3135280 RepID=A0ABU9AUK2_9BACT
MTRRWLMVRGIVFAYGSLVAQIVYSFASIPLALSYLSTAEFGMFGVISTISSYLMMSELGLTESFTRHLFDCKDGKDPHRYGRLFAAGLLALGIVSIFILVGGLIAAWFAPPLLNIPNELRREFLIVMVSQSVLAAITMATRMIGAPLLLHHRQDLSQIAQAGLFIIYYVVLHLAFRAHWGIYALIANQVAGLLWFLPFNALMCRRLGFFPERATFNMPSREEWSEVWKYSMNTFLIQLGGTVLMGLPQLLISSLVGLHAAGLWTVCTRVFGVLRQVAFRPFSIAVPMLLEYYVRGDVSLAVRRWIHVSQLVVATSGFIFAVAAANNPRFVELWTGVGSEWKAPTMHIFIAFFFLCFTAAGTPYGVIGFQKNFGISGFIPILQALVVGVIAHLIAARTGSMGIIILSSVGYLFGMTFFGMRHLAKTTGEDGSKLFFQAIGRPFLATPIVLIVALAFAEWMQAIPGYPGLVLSSILASMIGLPLMGYLGVSSEVRGELFLLILKPLRRLSRIVHKPDAADRVAESNAD